MQNPLRLRVQDPTGEIRYLKILNEMLVGTGKGVQVKLKDPNLPALSGVIRQAASSPTDLWLRVPDHTPPAQVGGIPFREIQLINGIKVQLGNTTLSVERQSQKHLTPKQPRAVPHWMSQSESGRKTLWSAKKAAETPLSVYLHGETGTGKELIAKLIHEWSNRRGAPFVTLHCGAIPDGLAESELFGHVKGAFTGSVGSRAGAFLKAHGGTLFLDEVGDLPPSIQVKILRFLENGEIQPVGSDRKFHSNVRLICATHKSLETLVSEGSFRQDLFYRLASITISIPSLRSRPLDIEYLASHFSRKLGKTLSPEAISHLLTYLWPGNVRELQHAIERASAMAGSEHDTLDVDAFQFLFSQKSTPPCEIHSPPSGPTLRLKEIERLMVLKALKMSNGNRRKAALLLGVARSTLFEMIKRHNLRGKKQEETQAA